MKLQGLRRALPMLKTLIEARKSSYEPFNSLWRRFGAPVRPFKTSPLTRSDCDQPGASKRRESSGDRSLLEFSQEAEADSWSFAVIPDFISQEEEQSLMKDVGHSLRGKKYQFDHWDGAIEGYRETEKSRWSDVNQPIIDKLKKATVTAMEGKSLTSLHEVHVLDLARDGLIKHHTDSVKFCGDVIAGLSLLSASVMELQHKDKEKWITALLPRLSLYIMKGVVRYDYTHAIPGDIQSQFKGQPILRDRRVSVICRTTPNNSASSI